MRSGSSTASSSRKAAKDGEDVDALRLELQQDYEDTLVNPYIAAERGYVDAVIPPSHTRGYVATALRLLERKIDADAAEEAREHPTVSGANDSTTVSGRDDDIVELDAGHDDRDPPHEPHIQVVKGRPTDEEIGAVIAVLAAASGDPCRAREQEENLWGHPVDRLRYSIFSWQRVTLLERTHLRHR